MLGNRIRLSFSLFILLNVIGCLCQRVPRCPSPAPCPLCPTPAPAPAAAAGKVANPLPPERHICECTFKVQNACSNDGAGDNCKWMLAFKAVKGNGRDVWTDFNDLNLINPNSAIAKEISDSREPFKNDILNEWNRLYIKQVKVEVFKEGVRKAWFLFKGVGSTRFNWFTQENLIASSYGNALKLGTFAIFSAQGYPPRDARFLINENIGDCSADCGYLNVVNIKADLCPWAKIGPKPYFLYSPKPDDCCVWHEATDCGGVKADIMLVIDVSSSITDAQFTLLIAFVKKLVNGFPIGTKKTQFGAISFSTDVRLEFKLNQYSTADQIQTALDQINNRGGGTRTDKALNYLKSTAFLPANGNRVLEKDVVFVLTDGSSNVPALTKQAIQNIRSENYIIYTVGIGADLNEAELNEISSDPDSIHSLRSDFNQLDQIVDRLIDSACRVASPVRSAGKGALPPPTNEKIADVFAISVKTCDVSW